MQNAGMGRLLSAFVLAVALDQIDPATDALVREADALPPGPHRSELWLRAANGYAQRDDRPADAVPLYRRVAAEPSDPVLAHAALDAVVVLHLDEGDLAGARADLALLSDPRLEAMVRRAEHRRYVHFAAIAVLLVTCALAFRGRRRGLPRRWPLAIAFSGFVAIGGALLASAFSAGTALPFLGFGVALAPLVMISLIWKTGPRALRAVACGASVLAAAFLVLERFGQLDGLGL